MTSPAGTRYIDQRGVPVALGARLGSPGGEGTVYEVAGDTARVAKIHHEADPARDAKLRAMIMARNADLRAACAWPEATLHDRPGGAAIGFVMSRAHGEPLDELYAPGPRLAKFPDATYRFVVEVCARLARAFAVVHASGGVVCDPKERNALATDRGDVTLIDCDGFQIAGAGGAVFMSAVATWMYQPPELHGKDLRKIVRTPDHDNFGLACLIFWLLTGWHPFSGRPLGGDGFDPEQAIRLRQFAFAPELPQRRLVPPPSAPPLAALGGSLGALFVRAFLSRPGETRPTAAEWESALRAYLAELHTCPINDAHAFVGDRCPHCDVEARTGVLLFGGGTISPVAAPDLADLWQRISSVAGPDAAPGALQFRPIGAQPTSAALILGTRRRSWKLAGLVGLGTLMLLGIGWSLAARAVTPAIAMLLVGLAVRVAIETNVPPSSAFEAAWRAADLRLRSLTDDWTRAAGGASFSAKFAELGKVRKALESVDAEHARRLSLLRLSGRLGHMERYLRSQRVARARIAGIGPSQAAHLRAYGIETAADVTARALAGVRGLGTDRVRALFLWRATLEQGLRPDQGGTTDARALAELERETFFARRRLEEALRRGPDELAQVRDQVLARRAELVHALESATLELDRAAADLQAVS